MDIVARVVAPANTKKGVQKQIKQMLIQQAVRTFESMIKNNTELSISSYKKLPDGKKEHKLVIRILDNTPIPGGFEIQQQFDKVVNNQSVISNQISSMTVGLEILEQSLKNEINQIVK